MSVDPAVMRAKDAALAVEQAAGFLGRIPRTPDPVEQRRLSVRAAQYLRFAANRLDDYGTIGE